MFTTHDKVINKITGEKFTVYDNYWKWEFSVCLTDYDWSDWEELAEADMMFNEKDFELSFFS